MPVASLLHELVHHAADREGSRPALSDGVHTFDYQQLAASVDAFAASLMQLGLGRGERVGIYLEKRSEFVVACFGAAAAGCVFVPINPVLKPEQVGFIVNDCDVRLLVTSDDRLALLESTLRDAPSVHAIITVDGGATKAVSPGDATLPATRLTWSSALSLASQGAPSPRATHRVIDTDMVAILYTSGSTGRPKGVVLSHRNMVAGAQSVASYLGNHRDDTLLAALPLSFDAGFSQLTTAFASGARVVLLNYLVPRDVLKVMARERVTGLTAVPPLYIQLAALDWPSSIDLHLRYFANTGGRMPRETLDALRRHVPSAKPFLMYGLTEAFRSTFLPPEQVDQRPDSIGKAIPNAEILVLREDGTPCHANEPGELVHRGPLVGMGYWRDAEKTAERYRLLPHRPDGLMLPEYAVFSGDTVRRDEEGFLYFIGRRDEMIKSSGYRISPTEVEEVLYATRLVGECAAFGMDDLALGQSVHVVVTPLAGDVDVDVSALLATCRRRMPAYMVPKGVQVVEGPLPRNPNGKIDRKRLASEHESRHHATRAP